MKDFNSFQSQANNCIKTTPITMGNNPAAWGVIATKYNNTNPMSGFPITGTLQDVKDPWQDPPIVQNPSIQAPPDFNITIPKHHQSFAYSHPLHMNVIHKQNLQNATSAEIRRLQEGGKNTKTYPGRRR